MKRTAKKTLVGIVGGIVLIVGIIAIPYPGPGWLIVFAGLGILATEFVWAQRILAYTREKYDGWTEWVKRQNGFVKVLIGLVTVLVVVVTIWLLNGYGLINNWLHLGQDWVSSPFFR